MRRNSPPSHSQKHSTTREPTDRTQVFKVTHPFHPLLGHEFALVDRRNTWGEDRVYFNDSTGKLRRLPTDWTSFATGIACESMLAGPSHFRASDLLQLVALIARQREVQPLLGRASPRRRPSSK